jgi:hypothetical protein
MDSGFNGQSIGLFVHLVGGREHGRWHVKAERLGGPKGVVIRVTFDSEPTHSIEQQQGGWQAILNNFARHVEANQKKS